MPRTTSKKPPHKKKSGFIVTYLCGRCGFTFARPDTEKKLKCSMCDAKGPHTEIEREVLTRESLFKHLNKSLENMMSNLEGAYNIVDKEGEDFPAEEEQLLQILAKGQKLKEDVGKIEKTS
ncbi:hypothetical protein KKC44_03520 [Patescibacteria group bacterium]|nr:hypothetical protein [Patescibacteria group bacterium]MBU2259653.1 hypothetical protein [Patescibacteria group bacterium]